MKIEDKKDYFVSTMERELRELRGMKTSFIKVCTVRGDDTGIKRREPTIEISSMFYL